MKFRFTTSERNGILILITLIIVLQVIHWVLVRQNHRLSTIAISDQERIEMQAAIDSVFAAKKNIESIYDTIKFFSFDPNIATSDELCSLGFKPKVASTIIKYRSAGGHFTTNVDLFKIYGIDSTLVEMLQPYIEFVQIEKPKVNIETMEIVLQKDSIFYFNPNTVSFDELIKLGFSNKVAGTFLSYRNKIGEFSTKQEILKVYGVDSTLFHRIDSLIILPAPKEKFIKAKLEVNSATEVELQALPGIGPILAKRMVKFRNSLGGFYSIEQMKEVYGLSDETFHGLHDLVVVDPSLIHRLNVNFATEKELAQLPKCNVEIARKIIQRRSNAGLFTSINDLRKIIDEENIETLKFYLTTE